MMAPEDIERTLIAVAAFTALLPAHMVGDHWIQTGGQSCKKDIGTNASRASALWHCTKHVATYTITACTVLIAVLAWLGIEADPRWVAAGQLISAITHFVADLRTPLRWLARVTGSEEFFDLADHGLNGRYLLDQSWHVLWVLVAAMVSAGPPAGWSWPF